MKIINAYGVGRTRDKYGNVTKWSYNPYVNCIHTQVGGGRINMGVYIAEIYEQDEQT